MFVPMVLMAAVLILPGVSACSTLTKQETPVGNNIPTATPASTTIPKSPVMSRSNKIPQALVSAGEDGENAYDMAKANNWPQAVARLASLKGAAKLLRTELPEAKANEEQLDRSMTALEQAITAKDRQAAMREANQVTRIVADMTAPFNLPVPVEITRLDYEGRELEVWAGAKDTARLKATADEIQRIWERLRPQVEAHGGLAEAKRFNDLASRVASAKTVDEYAHLATPVLDEVDNLEKAFQK